MKVQSPPTHISENAYLSDATHYPPPSVLQPIPKMPPQHTVLGSISGNRRKGQEISPYIRGQVAGQAFKGAKNAQIAKDLNLSDSTVRYTL